MSNSTNFFFGSNGSTYFYRDKKTTSQSASWANGARMWVNYKQLAGLCGCLEVLNYGFTGNALRMAGNHLAKCSKRNLRRQMKSAQGVTGNLLHSYAVRVNRKRDGVLIGFTKLGSHAHLVDQGHEIVTPKKKLKTGKRSKALHFHTDAKYQDMTRAMMIAQAQMQKDLLKRWEKLEAHAGRGMYNPYTGKTTTPAEIKSEMVAIQSAIAQISKDQDRLSDKYVKTYGIW